MLFDDLTLDFILMIVCSVSEIIHLNHNEIEECNK